MNKKFLAPVIAICVIVFLYGVAVGHYQIFPFSSLQQIQSSFESQEKKISSLVPKQNIDNLIKIENSLDIDTKRNSLKNFIWNEFELPKDIPDLIESNIDDNRYDSISNLSQIDKITINMDHEINSIAYHFHAKNPNGKLIIYHQGHKGDFYHGFDTIEFFVDNNFDVIAFSMPLLGMNNQPVLDTDFGKLKFDTHYFLNFLDKDEKSPMRFFLHPISVTLNYISQSFNYDSYNFVGISGGGWTAIVYSAIDPRISNTFSIAGSYPIFLRDEPKNYGDYEQILPEFYRIANYLELYVMGSYGKERSLTQIFNMYDTCCYDGEISKIYEKNIQSIIQQLGEGSFTILIDDSHKEHKISGIILNRIILQI